MKIGKKSIQNISVLVVSGMLRNIYKPVTKLYSNPIEIYKFIMFVFLV